MRKIFVIILSLSFFIVKADSYFLVHGLNNKFEIMNDIVSELEAKGHNVVKHKLLGHTKQDYHLLEKAKKDDFKEHFEKSYREMKGKKHLVAYSMGASTALYTMSRNPNIHFDSMTLIAPAFAIWPAYEPMINFLNFLGVKSLISLGRKDETAHSFSPLSLHLNLFEMEKDIHKIDSAYFNQIPTQVLMDDWDMLVRASGVRKWLKDNQLSNWKFIEMEVPRGVRHMATRKQFLPKESWEKIKSSLF